jgi:hypothetical protein
MATKDQPRGPTLVTVTASAPVLVITELAIDDGRERRPNGETPIGEGQTAHFIVGPQQSIRIVERD